MLDYQMTGSGETIVFLHGALISKTVWQAQVDFFKERFQVLTIDLPGHGGSEEINPFRIASVADAVISLTDTLDIRRFHLCGHSLGGMVAQEIAYRYPERIISLILAETSFGTQTTLFEKLGSGIANLLFKMLTQKQLVSMSQRNYGKLHKPVSKYIEHEMSAYAIEQTRQVMGEATQFDSQKWLANIHCPTLILIAEKNKQTHRQGKAINQLIQNSKLVVIPDSHHILNMDNPDVFNRTVEEFLDNQ